MRYLHSTNTVGLRVDDVYPAGFVEFIYYPMDSSDVLWRAFLALDFNNDEIIYRGRASDEGDLSSATFMAMSELELVEDTLFDSTMVVDSTDSIYDTTYTVDTIISYAETRCSFQSTDFHLELDQIVTSHYNGEPYIKVVWILRNIDTGDLDDGKCVFHFDGDVPDDFWDDDVPIEFPSKSSACQMASYSDSNCVGFIWLSGGENHTLENTLDWFHLGINNDSLISLIDGDFWRNTEHFVVDSAGDTTYPPWADSIYGDAGVGLLFSLPDMSSGDVETLSFYLAAAPTPDSFAALVDSFANVEENRYSENLPQKIHIVAYPNPFNSSVKIGISNSFVSSSYEERNEKIRVEICNIMGNIIAIPRERNRSNRGQKQETTEWLWHPDKSISSGVYLVRILTGDGQTATKKILYIK